MTARGPSNLAAPVNLVTIQAQLALADDENPLWEVQPGFLVFGRPRPPAQPHRFRRFHPRPPPADVLDAWTATADAFDGVVCLGVALSSIAYSPSNPDTGRFAVAVAGAVGLACDREALKHAVPGDTLYWEKKRSPLAYAGIHPEHRTAVIKALPARGIPIQRADYETAMEVHLARDPAALAFYKDPTLTEFDPTQPMASAVGGRIGTLLALGEDGTNECIVNLDL